VSVTSVNNNVSLDLSPSSGAGAVGDKQRQIELGNFTPGESMYRIQFLSAGSQAGQTSHY